MAAHRAILFDLDGTLTDPFDGITRSVQYALERLGHEVPPQDALRWMIGPPLRDSLPILLGTDDAALVDEGMRLYRERYSDIGKFENTLIEGIPEVLKALDAQGYFLSVATSKPGTYAREIIAHFDLEQYFDAQYGSGLDGQHAHKPELIGHILRSEGLDPARTLMIGDRSHDVIGASANAVRAIGVLWGFGGHAELSENGATAIARSPRELTGIIASLLPPAG